LPINFDKNYLKNINPIVDTIIDTHLKKEYDKRTKLIDNN